MTFSNLLLWIKGDVFVSSNVEENENHLKELECKMTRYYQQNSYPPWVHVVNSEWQEGLHSAQLRMCDLIPQKAIVLEVGCGKGGAGAELRKRRADIKYYGIDILSSFEGVSNYICGRANELPFRVCSFDVVISMFVIEHLVRPHLFLEEAWRVLKPGGSLIVLAPDFKRYPMCSQNLGLSFGTGREKIRSGKLLDAGLTFFDRRIRNFFIRSKMNRWIKNGQCVFPILLNPRCFDLKEQDVFVPDCDAVYWVCPEEVMVYLSKLKDFEMGDIFYRDNQRFGLRVVKNG